MPIRRSWFIIHLEMVFLFEIFQNTISEQVWEQGSDCFQVKKNCTNEFHIFILNYGLTCFGIFILNQLSRAIQKKFEKLILILY